MITPISFMPNYGMMISPDVPMIYAQFTAAQQSFAQKPKNRKGPAAPETHRAGDWVCILCHNLNYSFRKVCNRCQVQTKRENLIQSLSMLNKNSSLEQQSRDKEDNVAPPGLAKATDGKVKSEIMQAGSSSRREDTLHQDSFPDDINQSQLNFSSSKLTSSKGSKNDTKSTKQTASNQWYSYRDDKTDSGRLRSGKQPIETVNTRPFQLFDDSNRNFKDTAEFPPGFGLSFKGSLSTYDEALDESQHDSNVMRSLDYVLDECQE